MAATAALIRKLESIGTLTDAERSAILKLPIVEAECAPNQTIVRQGDRPDFAVLVLSGMIFRFKNTRDKRQIMSFHISGDIPDLHALFVDVLDHGITVAAAPARIAKIPHRVLAPFLRQQPNISELLWRETFIDSSIFGEWIVNVGRRTAIERTAHLLCESWARAKAVNLCKDGVCPLPLTQTHLSDATGLSIVHLNRSLQQLRRDKLVELKDWRLKIVDWERITVLGDFDEQYLHVKRQPDAIEHRPQ